MDKLLVRVPEAAEMLSMGRTSVYALISRGELPAVHLGASVRIPVEAIREFAARLEREAAGGGEG